MMLKILIITPLLLFININTQSLKNNEEAPVILCYGNSITAGYGLSPEQAFPAVLEQMIKESGIIYKVINGGLSGETSAGGLNRINWVLRQPIDIFILELGGNDGLRGLPLEQTEKNLQSIIDKVKEKYPQVKIVIAGMMIPPNMGEDYGNAFIKIFPKIAKANKAILIPFLLKDVGGNPSLNLADGIHPTAEGHQIVAKTVFDAIQNSLK